MAQLRQDYQKFVKLDTEVVAVGPEDARTFSNFWHSHHMPFVGIPDPQHVIARLFGQKVNLLKMGRMPALMVIDRAGRIRYQHYGDSMSDIPTDKDILSLLDDLKKESA
jgi:peroxiredoxin